MIDEIQRVPELLSWIQVMVDERRAAMLHLLPLSINEIRDAGLKRSTDELLLQGGYPRIHHEGLEPSVVLGDYFATYAERDLRQLMEVRHRGSRRGWLASPRCRNGLPIPCGAPCSKTLW